MLICGGFGICPKLTVVKRIAKLLQGKQQTNVRFMIRDKITRAYHVKDRFTPCPCRILYFIGLQCD